MYPQLDQKMLSAGIGLERARQTLRATTQRGTRSALLPISRRYWADRQFGVKQLTGKSIDLTILIIDWLESSNG